MVPGFHLSLGFTLGKAQILEWPTPLPSTPRWAGHSPAQSGHLESVPRDRCDFDEMDRCPHGLWLLPSSAPTPLRIWPPRPYRETVADRPFSSIWFPCPMDERITGTGRICLGRPNFRGKSTASLRFTGQTMEGPPGMSSENTRECLIA
jgi:hypothetical protein